MDGLFKINQKMELEKLAFTFNFSQFIKFYRAVKLQLPQLDVPKIIQENIFGAAFVCHPRLLGIIGKICKSSS